MAHRAETRPRVGRAASSRHRQSRTARRQPPNRAAACDPSSDSVGAMCGRAGGRRPAVRSSPARSSARWPACRRRRRLRTRACRSASRRARSRTPRRRSACRPGAPSPAPGAMYAAVPEDHADAGHHRRARDRRRLRQMTRGRRSPGSGASAFASPKSSTFTVPSSRTLMFAGFRSRWMIPCSCAASSASAICFAIGERLVERNGPA